MSQISISLMRVILSLNDLGILFNVSLAMIFSNFYIRLLSDIISNSSRIKIPRYSAILNKEFYNRIIVFLLFFFLAYPICDNFYSPVLRRVLLFLRNRVRYANQHILYHSAFPPFPSHSVPLL